MPNILTHPSHLTADDIISQINEIPITDDTEFDSLIDQINRIGTNAVSNYRQQPPKNYTFTYTEGSGVQSLKEQIVSNIERGRQEAINNTIIVDIIISFFNHQIAFVNNEAIYASNSYDITCHLYAIPNHLG